MLADLRVRRDSTENWVVDQASTSDLGNKSSNDDHMNFN